MMAGSSSKSSDFHQESASLFRCAHSWPLIWKLSIPNNVFPSTDNVLCHNCMICACLHTPLFVYLSICLCIHLSVYPSIYLSMYLSIYLPIYLSTYLPIYLSTYLPFNLSTYLSIYLRIYLSTYLSICLSLYDIDVCNKYV